MYYHTHTVLRIVHPVNALFLDRTLSLSTEAPKSCSVSATPTHLARARLHTARMPMTAREQICWYGWYAFQGVAGCACVRARNFDCSAIPPTSTSNSWGMRGDAGRKRKGNRGRGSGFGNDFPLPRLGVGLIRFAAAMEMVGYVPRSRDN